tara:strand:- start:287 stop:520 length:234 start_codon:yes stop_codon:yes gene_type:complete
VILNRNSETHRLLAKEAVEFLLFCLNNDMKLGDIQRMYIKKELTNLTYANVLQALINEHIDCHVRLSMKNEEEQRTT